jgi:hypothetical protein
MGLSLYLTFVFRALELMNNFQIPLVHALKEQKISVFMPDSLIAHIVLI